MSETIAVSIKLLDKQLEIGCPKQEKAALIASAEFLNEQLQDVRDSGVIGLERIALLTALNLSRELLIAQQGNALRADIKNQIASINIKLQQALEDLQLPNL